MTDQTPPRRGWREPIEPGIHRQHRVACPSTRDRRPGRRCECPYSIQAPAGHGRGSRTITVDGNRDAARRAKARAHADAGTVREVAVNDQTLREYAAEWFPVKAIELRRATIEVYDRAYRKRIDPQLGHLRLDRLTREELDKWLAALRARDTAERSIEQAIETLRSMLGTAVEWGRLPTNPAAGLRLPRRRGSARPSRAQRTLTPDQLASLLTSAGSLRTETMLRAAAEAGLRAGEIIALRWTDISLDGRRLRIRGSIWQGSTRERVEQSPKSGDARTAAITAALAARLAEFLAESVVERGADAEGFVWPGQHGRAMERGTPGQLLDRSQIRAGLVDDDGKPLVTFHGLRHTAASIALSRAVPLITVSRQLGHSRMDTTAATYAHLLHDGQLDAFAAAFSSEFMEEVMESAAE